MRPVLASRVGVSTPFSVRFSVAFALALSLASSLTFTPAPVHASAADAKDLFTKGRELRQAGDCANAIPLFKKAYQLYPQGLGSLRNAAECEEQVGRFASARRDWLELKRALLVQPDAKYEGWDADADAAAARLAPKVGRLTIDVTQRGRDGQGPLTDPKIRVLVNGELIDAKLLDTPLDRDPGTYIVRIEGGKAIVQKSVTLVAGDDKRLAMIVDAVEEKPSSSPLPKGDPSPTPTVDDGAGMRTTGWLLVGVGAAATVGTIVAVAMRSSALATVEKGCQANFTACNEDVRDDHDRGKTMSLLANVFGATAVVSLGVGVSLVVVGQPKTPRAESTTALRLSPWASPGGGGAVLGGTF